MSKSAEAISESPSSFVCSIRDCLLSANDAGYWLWNKVILCINPKCPVPIPQAKVEKKRIPTPAAAGLSRFNVTSACKMNIATVDRVARSSCLGIVGGTGQVETNPYCAIAS